MTDKVTTPVSTHSSASTHELLAEVVGPLMRLLTAAGLTADDLHKCMSREMAETESIWAVSNSVHLGAKQRDCMEVMCLWRRSPEFLDKNGLPAMLPIRGEKGSFLALCRLADVESSPADLLETLIAFRAIHRNASDEVSPETPTFLLGSRAGNGSVAIDGVLKQLAGFVRVVEHNVRQASTGGRTRFERACTVVVAEELLPVFERAVRDRGQEFIDAQDEWLERHESTISPSGRYVEVGVGAYFVYLGTVDKTIV